MYTCWTKITERDLIQKGTSYNKIKNILQIEKVVLNMMLPSNPGSFVSGKLNAQKTTKELDTSSKLKQNSSEVKGDVFTLHVMSLLAIISGQRPVLTKARKSIANWKIRKNQLLGCKVTLRGKTALDFLDKTIRFQNINEHDIFMSEIDNLKQKKGSNRGGLMGSSLQSLGNLSLGIKNLNLYPELESLWIAQNLGSKKLGLDLSLNFKNSQEVFNVLTYIIRKAGDSASQKLIENYDKNIHAFPVHIKTNKSVLALRNIIVLRKLYLTSLGLFV